MANDKKKIATKVYMLSWDEARLHEKTVRDFLLKKCNIIRYTSYPWSYQIMYFFFIPFWISIDNPRRDRKFAEELKKWQKDLIKTLTDKKIYNGIEQKTKLDFIHYFYNISNSVTKRLNKLTLLECPFGFNDPTFYDDNRMICAVISHEPVFVLYLTEEERRKLNRMGVVFD